MPPECSPLTYDLNSLKSRVERDVFSLALSYIRFTFFHLFSLVLPRQLSYIRFIVFLSLPSIFSFSVLVAVQPCVE